MNCPHEILTVCHKLQSKKKYSFDDNKKNLVAGLTSQDLYILNTVGLNRYLNELIGSHKISISMFLKSINPYQIHTDYQKKEDLHEQIQGKAVLIPLIQCYSHTIVFNQKAKTKQDIQNLPVLDNSIDDKTWNKYLEHCDPKLQHRLTIKSINKCEYGSPILWERDDLHSSDNHLTTIAEKNALLIFTKLTNLP